MLSTPQVAVSSWPNAGVKGGKGPRTKRQARRVAERQAREREEEKFGLFDGLVKGRDGDDDE